MQQSYTGYADVIQITQGGWVNMPLIDVEGVRRERLSRIAGLAKAAGAANELADALGPSPTSSLAELAERGGWKQVSNSAERHKDDVRKTVARGLSDLSEANEAVFPLAQQMMTGRPFLHVGSPVLEQVEAGLKDRDLDPKYARRAVHGIAKPLGQTFLVAAESLARAWTQALRRDAEMNLVRAVADFNLSLADGASPTGEAQQLASAVRDLRETQMRELSERLRKGPESYIPLSAARAVAVASDLLGSVAIPRAASVKHDDRSELESVGLVAADCIRELLWLIAALKNAMWRCTWPQIGQIQALRGAAELPPLAKPAKVRPTEALALARGRPPTDLVELAGSVEQVVISHEARGKPVTRLVVSGADVPFVVQVNGSAKNPQDRNPPQVHPPTPTSLSCNQRDARSSSMSPLNSRVNYPHRRTPWDARSFEHVMSPLPLQSDKSLLTQERLLQLPRIKFRARWEPSGEQDEEEGYRALPPFLGLGDG